MNAIAPVVALALASLSLPASAAVTPQDRAFVVQAAQIEKAEEQLAVQAIRNSQNVRVKQYGNRLLHDNELANSNLQNIAHAEGMTLPQTPDAMHQAMEDRHSDLRGGSFDAAYLHDEQQAQRHSVDVFTNEAMHGSDAALVRYAKANLPLVKSYEAMVSSDIAQLGGHAASHPPL